jgi:predicted metal-dependent phosphoesterase TrpH
VGKVDLHIHTSASDGRFSPAEIVRRASEAGLAFIAICDHDSIEGVVPAQSAALDFPGLTVIGGVEINTDIPAGELHLLGYFCDCQHAELAATLATLRSSRVERAIRMIKKLKGLGMRIDYERVEELAGKGSVGRPHIAQALLEKGYILSLREAFIKYLGRGGPAYIERDKITPAEATGLILRAGGIPVMAHPFTFDKPEALIGELKGQGLKGLEVYYGSYSPEQVRQLLDWSLKYDLIATGGSDYHGLDAGAEPPLGTVEVPLEAAQCLIALAGRK